MQLLFGAVLAGLPVLKGHSLGSFHVCSRLGLPGGVTRGGGTQGFPWVGTSHDHANGKEPSGLALWWYNANWADRDGKGVGMISLCEC